VVRLEQDPHAAGERAHVAETTNAAASARARGRE
jgi:hypothetical protein